MPRADLTIKAEVQARLADLDIVIVDNLEIAVAEGIVLPGGYVAEIEARSDVHHAVGDVEGVVGMRDRRLKPATEEIVARQPGVSSVNNLLEVES